MIYFHCASEPFCCKTESTLGDQIKVKPLIIFMLFIFIPVSTCLLSVVFIFAFLKMKRFLYCEVVSNLRNSPKSSKNIKPLVKLSCVERSLIISSELSI